MKILIISILFFSNAFLVNNSSAQISLEDAQVAREARLAVFELLSFNMEPIAGIARRTTPFDAALVERNALRIAKLATMIPQLFTIDTRSALIYTRAKDFIWDNGDTFIEHAADLERAALALAEVGVNNDADAAVSSVRALGRACGACHDLFRFQLSDPALPVAKPE